MKIEFTAAPELEKFESIRKEMMSVRWEGEKAFVRINSSSLSILQECKRKAYYSLYRGLQSKVESAATCFGSGIHKGLEVGYLAKRAERIIPPNYEKLADLIGAGVPEVEGEHEYVLLRALRAFVNAAAPLKNLPDSDKRSIASGVWLLTNYFKSHPDDPYEVYYDDKGPLIERKCEAVVYEDDKVQILLHGQIDCILHNADTKTILICDHKTSSIIGEQFYSRLHVNHQYSCYTLLAQKALGIHTDKFLVNILQVKARPVTSRGQAPHFPRQVTVRSDEMLTEFVETLVYYVQEYLNLLRQEKTLGIRAFPLSHVGVCSAYNGCQFLKICSSPHSIRESIVTAEFHGR